MRDREYSLFDGRNLGQPLKTQRVDTGTAAFIPVADIARGIVYFAGKVHFSKIFSFTLRSRTDFALPRAT